MSQHPSPGPSPHSSAAPPMQMQGGPPPPTPARQKSKTFAPGITAGAEDAKYQTKYKELKRKVREIESDNDKLQFKVLQAKKSINRMKIERAVLYDRLSQVPPSPDLGDRHAALPPIHTGPGVPPHPSASAAHHHRERELAPIEHSDRDRAHMEYTHAHPSRAPAYEPGLAPSPAHSSRHAHEPSRQLPPLSQLAPAPHQQQQHLEPPRLAHAHSHSHSPHSAHTHTRTRSHSGSSRSRTVQGYAAHPEGLSPLQHIRSPPMLSEREAQAQARRLEPPAHGHSPRASARAQHPALGELELERQRERELEADRAEREWEYDQQQQRALARGRELAAQAHRAPTPPFGYRQSRPADYHDAPAYRREEQYAYHREAGPGGHSTPGSGSGSGGGEGPPRADYERDRTRAYAPRAPVHEDEYVREERTSAHVRDRSSHGAPGPGGHPSERERLYSESRKRNYHEMEVDGDMTDAPPSAIGAGSSVSRKRIHRDTVDSEEDEDDLDA